MLDEVADLAAPADMLAGNDDRKALERRIHKLKGGAGALAAVPLYEAAGELERLLRDGGDADEAAARVARLLAELSASSASLLAGHSGEDDEQRVAGQVA